MAPRINDVLEDGQADLEAAGGPLGSAFLENGDQDVARPGAANVFGDDDT